MAAVFAYLATVITNTGTADVLVNESFLDGSSSTLAFAGPIFYGTGGCTDPFPLLHITTGVDPCSGGCTSADGFVTVNFGQPWNSDLGAPSGSEYDLFSVLLHELTHLLGFVTGLSPTGPADATRLVYDGPPRAGRVYVTRPQSRQMDIDDLLIVNSSMGCCLGVECCSEGEQAGALAAELEEVLSRVVDDAHFRRRPC